MLSEGKNAEQNNPSPVLKQAKIKGKKSIIFSNCREKKYNIPGMLLSFEN